MYPNNGTNSINQNITNSPIDLSTMINVTNHSDMMENTFNSSTRFIRSFKIEDVLKRFKRSYHRTPFNDSNISRYVFNSFLFIG
ncbi:hypothetical protein CEXT_763091 [Caerostris extrusa]|uniref:Ycf1 n=1 Tax=Caerostris extrusa TaxID=172846 RepID=A0AAV4XG69_CAEEX|nr:hypothetical protein CEXT_763091 [Caerostris extrusa]